MADDLLAQRRAKLERLREQGINPYPHAFEGVESIASVRDARFFNILKFAQKRSSMRIRKLFFWMASRKSCSSPDTSAM